MCVCVCVFVLAARRKLLEKARQAGLGGFKKTSGTKPTVKEMWDGEGGKFPYCEVVDLNNFILLTATCVLQLLKTFD